MTGVQTCALPIWPILIKLQEHRENLAKQVEERGQQEVAFRKELANHFFMLKDRIEVEKAARTAECAKDRVDLEERFGSLALDIIGSAVFNYDFDSVKKESPIIKAVYEALKETEARSMSFIPYWKLPLAKQWLPQLQRFHANMDMLNGVLTKLIAEALESSVEADVDELEREWRNDAKGATTMGRERFYDCIFELVDVWCKTTKKTEYVEFLTQKRAAVALTLPTQTLPDRVKRHFGFSWGQGAASAAQSKQAGSTDRKSVV